MLALPPLLCHLEDRFQPLGRTGAAPESGIGLSNRAGRSDPGAPGRAPLGCPFCPVVHGRGYHLGPALPHWLKEKWLIGEEPQASIHQAARSARNESPSAGVRRNAPGHVEPSDANFESMGRRWSIVALAVAAALGCRRAPTPSDQGAGTARVTTPSTPAAPSSTAGDSGTGGTTRESPPITDPNRVRSQEGCPEGMVFVPGGTLRYPWLAEASVYGGTMAESVHEGPVGAFCIDRREVESLTFERSNCKREPNACGGLSAPAPATCVTLESASCFCSSGTPGVSKRLPTAEEWLFAAVGTSGKKFPWGNTWFPWGNDRYQDRPDTGKRGERFCARELDPNYHAQQAAALVDPNYPEFSRDDCTAYDRAMDKSPFGVENMGSSVLELTTLVVLAGKDDAVSAVFGLDHSRQTLTGEFGNPSESLVSARGPHRDGRMSMEFRAMKHVGFRCVVSELGTEP